MKTPIDRMKHLLETNIVGNDAVSSFLKFFTSYVDDLKEWETEMIKYNFEAGRNSVICRKDESADEYYDRVYKNKPSNIHVAERQPR